MLPCVPFIRHATTHAAHRLRHRLHHAVRRASGAHHALKTAISPHVTAGGACKAGFAMMVAGGLLTGWPAKSPLDSDGMTISTDGAARSSPMPPQDPGAAEQASPRSWASGSGNDPMLPAVLPGWPTTSASENSPAFPDPFAFHAPAPFAGSGAAGDLGPVLNEPPPDLASGLSGDTPGVSENSAQPLAAVSVSDAPVDEPSSAIILLAALLALAPRCSFVSFRHVRIVRIFRWR